jgi:uncharacterized protein YyaL (SSP411 family)
VFHRPDWLARAEAAFDFVLTDLGMADGRVAHAWRLGRVTAAGLIDDQAAMARAALALYEASGSADRLAAAIRLVESGLRHYADSEAGGFFSTADDATDIPLARPRTGADNATPSGNGVIAEVFARLWHLTGDAAWRACAEATIRSFSGNENQLAGMPSLLTATDLLEEAATVVIAGAPEQAPAQALAIAALTAPDPAVVVLRAPDPASLPANHPAHGKQAGRDGAAAYVCRRNVCGLPVASAAELAQRLARRTETT